MGKGGCLFDVVSCIFPLARTSRESSSSPTTKEEEEEEKKKAES
jgi:hypothetical protein